MDLDRSTASVVGEWGMVLFAGAAIGQHMLTRAHQIFIAKSQSRPLQSRQLLILNIRGD